MTMARRKDTHIFFPWERRAGLLRRVRLDQARPFLLLGVAFTLVIWVALRERRDAGVRRTRNTILAVRPVLDSYLADRDGGCPPRDFAGLAPYGGAGTPPTDAWGRPLRIECPGRDRARYDLFSDGPDGLPGGLDRIE